MNKPRIIKDFEKLSEEITAQIKLEYPYGFEKKLIQFKNKEGKFVSALPYETEDHFYLIRMTRLEAQELISDDDDYDDDGNLTDDAKDKLEDIIDESAVDPSEVDKNDED